MKETLPLYCGCKDCSAPAECRAALIFPDVGGALVTDAVSCLACWPKIALPVQSSTLAKITETFKKNGRAPNFALALLIPVAMRPGDSFMPASPPPGMKIVGRVDQVVPTTARPE